MKTGGKVRVWPEGEKSRATTGKVVITSENGRSLAIGFGDPAECVVAMDGVAIHPEHGIMLLLFRTPDDTAWADVFHETRYEVEEINERTK